MFFSALRKKRPSGNDLMKLPITQEHIDEAMRRIIQRRFYPEPPKVKAKPKQIIAKPKKPKKQRYIRKRDEFDKMMDYAIWKDKD